MGAIRHKFGHSLGLTIDLMQLFTYIMQVISKSKINLYKLAPNNGQIRPILIWNSKFDNLIDMKCPTYNAQMQKF